MNYLLIRHKVADFAKWKPAYDAHGSARANAGLKEERLLRNVDNPNEVVLLFSAQDCRRSEEHTSELQSRRELVCRLLLEKKKIDRPRALPLPHRILRYESTPLF